MDLTNNQGAKQKLALLQEEHVSLDKLIDELSHQVVIDQLAVKRLKKRKLVLKDEIAKLKAMLLPDIIA